MNDKDNSEKDKDEDKVKEQSDKKSVWRKLKLLFIAGASGAIIIAGGKVIVGVNQDSNHADGKYYAVDPVTNDSSWYDDTTDAYKAIVDSFLNIKFVKDSATTRPRIRSEFSSEDTNHFANINDIFVSTLTKNGVVVEQMVYKCEFPPAIGNKIYMDHKLNAVEGR